MIVSLFSLYDLLIPLIVGFVLDALVGDPYWMPHPIRLFGKMIAFFEHIFNRGKRRKVKGAFTAILLVSVVFGTLYILNLLLKEYSIIKNSINSILFFYALSNRNLIDEALKVERKVTRNKLEDARRQLSQIVGRDTSQLSFHQIRMATLETMSENLSDGIVAPIFFYAIGGIPLMMAYKMINTLDSMIGYKNDRYEQFGWFAARILDDGANFIPARLTAFFMVMVPPSLRGWRFVRRYARCHKSPNSGFPESALAGILDCRFGGPNIYHGVMVDKPYIGNNPRELTHEDILCTVWVNIRVSLTCVVAVIVVLYLCFY